jgi:hypothetical protein
MSKQAVTGLTTTCPYEATSPGVARHQCDECGGWERSDKGQIRHGKRCESRPQAKTPATQLDREIAESIRDQELKTFAANVHRTSLTKGRDQDVLDAVRKGYLSVDDAMNTDD